MKKNIILIFLLFTYFFNSQSISLDTTFGNGGYSTYYAYNDVSDVVMLSDGQFITCTYGDYNINIRKVNQNGALDNVFGTKVISMGVNKSLLPYKMLLQNNKLIIVGRVNANPTYSNMDVFITRLNIDGTLDTTFGTNGFKTFDFGNEDYALDLDVDNLGNSYFYVKSYNNKNLLKIKSDGLLDSSFGTNGILQTNSLSTDPNLNRVYLQNDGKFILAGSKSNSISNLNSTYLEKRLSNGTIDSSFGNNGSISIVDSNLSIGFSNLEFDYINNSILVLNQSNSSFFLSKIYLDSGSYVSSFANNGNTAKYSFTDAPNIELKHIKKLSNSKILIAGNVSNFFGPQYNKKLFFVKLDSNGNLDYSSNSGFQVFNTTPPNTSIRADYIPKLFILDYNSFVLAYSGDSVTYGKKSFLTKFSNEFLGVENIVPNNDNTFIACPNPASEFIKVSNIKNSLNSFDFLIYDSSGKIIKMGQSEFEKKINIQSLPSGSYYIVIKIKNEEKYQVKFIKI